MIVWTDRAQKTIGHPAKRRIIESLQIADCSFSRLLLALSIADHGKLGYYLRTLEGFVALNPSTGKYYLTERGRLLAACIQDFQFMASMNNQLEKTLQRLGPGDHAIGFCETDLFKRKICHSFIRIGLLKEEAVMYVASEHALDSEVKELGRSGITSSHPSKGAFTVTSSYEWYLRKGKAQTETIIANWQGFLKEKKKAGFASVRVVGDLEVFFENARVEELLRYEEALGKRLTMGLCGLCLYGSVKLYPAHLSQLLNCHGYILSKDIVGKV